MLCKSETFLIIGLIILDTIFFIMIILLNAFSIKEMIYRNKIFRLTGYFPSYLNDYANTMSNHQGITRFLIHLFLLFLFIFNVILFLVFMFWESKAENNI